MPLTQLDRLKLLKSIPIKAISTWKTEGYVSICGKRNCFKLLNAHWLRLLWCCVGRLYGRESGRDCSVVYRHALQRQKVKES